MREILTRLVDRTKGAVEIKIFGDKVILDEGKPQLFSCARRRVDTNNLELNFRILDYRGGKLATL